MNVLGYGERISSPCRLQLNMISAVISRDFSSASGEICSRHADGFMGLTLTTLKRCFININHLLFGYFNQLRTGINSVSIETQKTQENSKSHRGRFFRWAVVAPSETLVLENSPMKRAS